MAETHASMEKIQHVIVIYAENRSFDNLYGEFPNANGIKNASIDSQKQLDANGQVLPYLPPAWEDKNKQADLIQPFKINQLGIGHQLPDKTRDLVHHFYQNQEQINGGKNNRFAEVLTLAG